VRTSGSPVALRPAIEREARALDPTVIVSRVATLDAIVTQAQAPWRLAAWGLSLFAALAIVLAMVGLISLVALDVANRRREMAIRMALGAGARALVAGVMEVAMRRVVLGVGIGVALALAATRTLTALFVEVTAADWATYVIVALAVTGVALLASFLPAARAITFHPLTLLRRD
jgi:putative ABC transport system permease protein